MFKNFGEFFKNRFSKSARSMYRLCMFDDAFGKKTLI